MRVFVKWWLPVVLWMAVIFLGSSIGNVPRVGGQTSDAIVHRVAHLAEFALLGALLMRAVSRDRALTKRAMIVTLVILALYGASDEFHQRFTPGRSSEGIAVAFDLAGGAIGAWAYWRWLSVKARQRTAVASQHKSEAAPRAETASLDSES